MVKRSPTPRERSLADDITEVCDGENDNAVVLNALTTVLAEFLFSLDTGSRNRFNDHLKTAIPELLGDLEAKRRESAAADF